MKIQIVIPLWKRPEVTQYCFDRLKILITETKHEIKVLCVISETYYGKVCEDYGFEYVYAENFPVGAKINAGIKASLANDWDYLMMMNSDNVIKSELIDKYYEPFFESREQFFGVDRVTYVKFGTNQAREMDYNYSILGIGKCVRRDVVEASFRMGGPYRPDLSKCLDDTMLDRMLQLKAFPRMVKYKGQLAMDFKSDVNIWPWEHFEKKGKEAVYAAE